MAEFQTLLEWLTDTLPGQLVLLGLPVLLVVLTNYARRRDRGSELAEWIAESGQYEQAPQSLVDELIALAQRNGKKNVVLGELANIRRLYGHDGVRVGHILWVMERMEGESDVDTSPPSFVDPNAR